MVVGTLQKLALLCSWSSNLGELKRIRKRLIYILQLLTVHITELLFICRSLLRRRSTTQTSTATEVFVWTSSAHNGHPPSLSAKVTSQPHSPNFFPNLTHPFLSERLPLVHSSNYYISCSILLFR